MSKIPTKDETGKLNGWLLPVWNANEHPELRPDQVYVVGIAPGCHKGPHLHRQRRGMLFCVQGTVTVRMRSAHGAYSEVELSPACQHTVIPAGAAAAIYNDGDPWALVVNMPSPAYDPANPDDHSVENWSHGRHRA